MALRLLVPGCPRAEGQGLVLEGALAATVADGAVQRVVDEEQLEDGPLGFGGSLAVGADDHPVRDGRGAGGEQLLGSLHLDEAHPAGRDRRHARVVAEARDEDVELLGDIDQQPPLVGLDLPAVDRHVDLVTRHRRTPRCREPVREDGRPARRCR